MNEKLAIEILSRIKNGMQGYHDIKTGIKAEAAYFTLKDQEFAEVIAELKDLNCIRNLSQGHPKHYELFPGRDCLPFYEARINEQKKHGEGENEIRELTIKNLKLQNEVLALEKRELKRKFAFGIIGFFAGAIVTNLKDILQWFSQLSK